jgi:hypothetical protein
MQLTKPQQTIADDTNRWRVVVAGRRFGKTFLAVREMCYFAREPNKTVYYIAPTYRMARTIVWEELKTRLINLRWVKKVNETDLRIELVNGSKIFLRGADNVDSMRGIFISGIVIFDEYANIDPEIWTVIRPALADKGGHALWIGTPAGKSSHFYELYEWAQHEAGWSTYRYTSAEGGQIPPEELEAAKRDMDDRTYRQEFEASWEDYKGLVYYAYNEEHNTKLTDAVPQILHVGLDFNVDPGCGVIAAQTINGLHIIDEIFMRNTNTFEMADEIIRRWPNKTIVCYPDPAGSQRRTSSNTTDHKILYNAGFNVRARRSHPAVKDRINSVNSAFSSGRLHIDPNCKNLRNSLNRLSYREGTNEQDKNSGWDHMPDALGYMVEYLYPITKQQTPRVEPARWAVNAPAVRKFG